MSDSKTTIKRPSVAPIYKRYDQPSFLVRLTRNLAWVAAALVAVYLISDGVFRACHVGEDDIVEVAPVIGFFHIPNKFYTWRQEGYSQGKHNSIGMRDIEYTQAKPFGVKRIAVIGDSMTESYQVAPEDSFVKRLESKLSKDGSTTQVMNFGMSGFSTMQELYMFKEIVSKYHPDICVLSYHVGDNEKNIDYGDMGNFMPRPYGELNKDGQLTTSWLYSDAWQGSNRQRFNENTEWLRANSRLWGVWERVDLQLSTLPIYQKFKDRLAGNKSKGVVENSAAARKTLTANDILGHAQASRPYYLPEPPAFTDPLKAIGINGNHNVAAGWRGTLRVTREHFAVTSAAIALLNQACNEANCKLVVDGLPANYNCVLYFGELRGMKELARRDSFLFVDNNEVFPRIAPMEKSPLYYAVHFSALGHERVAQQLAEAIRSGGLLK